MSESNGYLSADDLLGAFGNLQEQDFTHPALRGKLRLREVTARAYFEILGAGADDTPKYYAMWAQAGIIHPQTKQPLLTPFQLEQITEGRQKLLEDIANAVVRLSRVGANDLEAFRTPDDSAEQDAGASAADAGGDAETDAG
jgi:hypothetical protein